MRSSAGVVSGYFNKSVFLVVTLTEEYKVFWLGRRAPNSSFGFLEPATSVCGIFNRDSGKGTPRYRSHQKHLHHINMEMILMILMTSPSYEHGDDSEVT